MRSDQPAALEARGLRRRHGAQVAVNGLDLTVAAGELYGLVGPDGAGKTTTIRLLAGLLRPDAGVARIVGVEVRRGGIAVREATGYMPQQYSLYGDLSVAENLEFFGELFGLSGAERRRREDRLLELCRLAPFRERRADALSGGMYKKLALSCALLHRPRVLLLDEPTNGVDPVSRRELWELLYEFVAEGMAVLLATPYMDEAARCHKVGLLDRGRLLAEGAPGDLVRAHTGHVVRLRPAARARVEDDVEARPEVVAVSPEGAELRVVVRPGGLDAFTAWAAATGLPAVPAAPTFEDVFLDLVARQPLPSGAQLPSPSGRGGGGEG